MQHLCICTLCMSYVRGSRWNKFGFRSRQFGTKASLISDVIHNSENPESIIWVLSCRNDTWNSWHGRENGGRRKITSLCFRNFVFFSSRGATVFPEVSHRRRSSRYGSFQWYHWQQHPLQPHHGEQGGAGEGRHGCWHTQQDPGATTGSGWDLGTWRMHRWTCCLAQVKQDCRIPEK